MSNKADDKGNPLNLDEQTLAENREYLVELSEKIEDEDRMTRLLKACMHLTIQGALIGFDNTLSSETRISAMEALSKAAAELSALGGFSIPPLKTSSLT
jgi:hypothetical protein